MSKFFKVLLSVLAIGLILVIIGFIGNGGDITNLKDVFTDDEEFTFATVTETNALSSLVLDTENRRFEFYKSETEELKFEYYESEKYVFSYTYENGTAKLKCDFKHKWFFFNWFIYTSSEYLTLKIYLPNSFNGDIDGYTSNGDITLSDYTLNNVEFDTSNGTYQLKNLTVNNLDLGTSNGRLNLTDIVSTNKVIGSTSNGEVNLKNIKASEINVKTSNGPIYINSAEALKQTYKTSNGRIVGDDLTGDHFDADTSNGRIELNVNGRFEDYRVDTDTSNGKTRVGDYLIDGVVHPDKTKTISTDSSNGDIYINFKEVA